jgi:hypothetical protein
MTQQQVKVGLAIQVNTNQEPDILNILMRLSDASLKKTSLTSCATKKAKQIQSNKEPIKEPSKIADCL